MIKTFKKTGIFLQDETGKLFKSFVLTHKKTGKAIQITSYLTEELHFDGDLFDFIDKTKTIH